MAKYKNKFKQFMQRFLLELWNDTWNVRFLVDEPFISVTMETSILYGRLSDFRSEFLLHRQTVVQKDSYTQSRSSQLKTTSDRSNHIATFFAESFIM